MADIFVSYASGDRARVKPIVEALEGAGYSVWWDRQIEAGSEFSQDILNQLQGAGVIVVLWSNASTTSAWVRDEASQALRMEKLVPALLDDCEPPLGFQQYQTIDLGQTTEDQLQRLCHTIDRRLGGIEDDSDTFQPKVGTNRNRDARPDHPSILDALTSFWRRHPIPFISLGALSLILAFVLALFLFGQMPGTAIDKYAQETLDTPRKETSDGSIGVAVIPFVSMSSDPDHGFFADGLSEELLNWLGNIEGLKVPGRTTSFSYKDSTDDLRVIGERLGVDYLLEGSVRQSGDTLRITAQLIEAKSGFHLWSDTYDRKLDGIFAIQDEIARKVVLSVLGALPEEGLANPAAVGEVDARAHQIYLEGRALWSQRRWLPAYEKFRQAVEIDPEHALAQAYLAVVLSYTLGKSIEMELGLDDTSARMDEALAQAVRLAPGRADVLFAQGFVLDLRTAANLEYGTPYQNKRAEELYRAAVRLYPRHVEALYALARISGDLRSQSDFLETILDIDPAMVSARVALVQGYQEQGRLAEAAQIVEETYVLSPETSRSFGAIFYKYFGDIEREATLLFEDNDTEGVLNQTWKLMAGLLSDLGQPDLSMKVLQYGMHFQPRNVFWYWHHYQMALLRGDRQEQFRLREKAFETNHSHTAMLLYADGLGEAEKFEESLARLYAMRPEILDDPDFEVSIGMRNSIGDPAAMLYVRALEHLGRQDEAKPILLNVLAAEEAIKVETWRKHLHLTYLYGHLGETNRAISELKKAYQLGFRSIRSFDCLACIEDSFYSRNEIFEPLFDEPEFQAMVRQIEAENEALWRKLDGAYGVTAWIEEATADVEDNTEAYAPTQGPE